MGGQLWGNRGWEFKLGAGRYTNGRGVFRPGRRGYRPAMTDIEREESGQNRSTIHSMMFLLIVFAGLEAFLWLVIPARQTALTVVCALLVLAVLIGDPLRRRESAAAIGLTHRNLVDALPLVLPPTLIAGYLIIVVGISVPDGGSGQRFLKRFLQVLPWALLQQGLLQATFNRRLTAAFGPGLRTSAVNGVFFGAMHLPGPALTLGTFLAGIGWSWVYQKKPNLWALVLSHALLSAAAQSFLPAAWTHGFRVGPGYFRWG